MTVDAQEHCLCCSPMLSSTEQRGQRSNDTHSPSHRLSHTNSTTTAKSLNNRISFTCSPSSSTSSSASLSPSLTSQFQNKPRTMEEVWKDISFASLPENPPSSITHRQEPRLTTHHHTQNPNCIFQDFLNGPLNHDQPTSLNIDGDTSTASALYASPLPPPATVLSLNSGAGFEFLDNSDPLVTHNSLQSHRHVSSFNTPFEALVASARLECFGKKRGQDSDGSSSDRRHKRMIKNRESAARSRARKQAYTNELEIEVAHLQAENARLRRQQDQLRMAAASQPPKKNMLQRSSTAPF